MLYMENWLLLHDEVFGFIAGEKQRGKVFTVSFLLTMLALIDIVNRGLGSEKFYHFDAERWHDRSDSTEHDAKLGCVELVDANEVI
jgi:hypothetical protein